MTRRMIAAWLLLAFAAAPLRAAPVIEWEQGTYYLQPGLSGQVLAVTVSGGDAVPGVEFYVQIGDGGAANGGTDAAPAIAAIDLIGAGKVFQGAAGSGPRSEGPLIWMDDVVIPDTIPPTVPHPTVPADGTLATVTIDTTGAAGGSYALRLQGVNALDYPGGLSTHFTPFGPTPTIHDGRIVILHPMTWNNGSSGTWTGGTWSGTPPSYPDDSAETIIDTAYTVSLLDPQQTYTLAVSNGGQLSVGAAGALTAIGTVTLGNNGTLTLAPLAGLTTPGVQLSGGTLAVSGGAYLLTVPVTSAGGTLSTADAGDNLTLGGLLTAEAGSTLNKTGSGTVNITGDIDHAGEIAVAGGLLKYDLAGGKTVMIGSAATLSIASGATVELAGTQSGTSAGTNRVAVTNDSTAGGLRILPGTNQVLGAIGGSGKTSVLAGASLTADSLSQGALDIAATGSLAVAGNVTLGSGGALTLAPGADLTATNVQLNAATLAVSGGAYSLVGIPVTSAGGTLSTADAGDSLTLGELLTAAASSTLNKTGSGTANITGGIDHAGDIAVAGGLLKYDLTGGKTVMIGSAATLSIASGATVELAGTQSGTSDGTNRVAVTNDSTAGGLQISGTSQVLGAIGGSGKTTVLAGADLVADSIVQDTLEIGAGGSLVIRESTGGGAALLLAESSAPLPGGSVSVSSSGGTQAVPEPGALVLLLCGLLPLAGWAWRKRRSLPGS